MRPDRRRPPVWIGAVGRVGIPLLAAAVFLPAGPAGEAPRGRRRRSCPRRPDRPARVRAGQRRLQRPGGVAAFDPRTGRAVVAWAVPMTPDSYLLYTAIRPAVSG
jgi:hypothetical protein